MKMAYATEAAPVAGSSLLLELSLEHPEFPALEAGAFAGWRGDECTVAGRRIATVRTGGRSGAAGEYASSLAFTMRVSALHGVYDSWEALRNGVSQLALSIKGESACIRVASGGPGGKVESERELGALLAGHCPVKLVKPDREIRVVTEAGSHYLAIKSADVDRRALDSRQAKYRQFFSPISLSPRFARAFLNICGARRGKRVLDPFCGTGGIAMEAVLLGADVVGSDIDGRMVEGTALNLRQIGLEQGWELHRLDVGEIGSLGSFDAVVTDPPYGRSSFANRESIAALYSRALDAISECLKPGGLLGIVVPDPSLIPATSEMHLKSIVSHRVHRSLTRHFIVMEKGRVSRTGH